MMPSIKIQGQTFDYTIRESKRAKRINIRVDAKTGIEVIYPVGVRQPTAKELLTSNQAWLLQSIDKVQARAEAQFTREYTHGAIFPYLGEDYALNIIRKTHGTRITVKLRESTLDVSIPPAIKPREKVEEIKSAIERFYRKQAKDYLSQRTQEIADELGFQFERITIKNQKTRWGSCSTGRNLNFNLRLMMTPPDAIDYIIIHELCHLVHMNHSKAFWNLVAKYNPTYKVWRKWFKQNSQFLVL